MKQTAMVTGASRGVGRGVAIGLADAAFEVFATGRSIGESRMPEPIRCIRCDHTQDDQNRCRIPRRGNRDWRD